MADNETVSTRKIYEKAIYSREKQMDRKVYQRANNVLPTTEPEPEPTAKTYKLKTVVIKTAGEDYPNTLNLTVDGTTDGVIALEATDGALTSASITTAGVFAEDISGDINVTDEAGKDGVVTVTCEEITE